MSEADRTSTSDSEAAFPHPRRYWWLVRLAGLYVLILAAAVGVRLWWGDVAQRRMTAAIDAAHARGERILVGDYAKGYALADEQNGAFYLARAEKALKFSQTEEWALDNGTSLPLRADIASILDQALAKNAAALADIRTGRQQEKADWNVNVFSPMWSVLLPHLNLSRRLANVSRAAAIRASHHGDHFAAVEHARDIHGISRTLNDQPFLVTHLVRIGIDAICSELAGEIAVDLRVADADIDVATQPADGAASRAQVQALIDSLLDDAPRQASIQHGLQGERAMQVDTGISIGSRARIVRPALQLDVLQLIREGEQIMAAAAASDWPTARTLMPPVPTVSGPRVTAHVISQSIRPALTRTVSSSLRAAARSRLAAVALAIRLYQHDHAGQRPGALTDLVPDYLPAVPIDPFAAGRRPIGYVPDRLAPYVYSVGENGSDDSATPVNGAPGWRPDATTTDPLKAPDLFLRLTRHNAPPPDISDPPEDETDPSDPTDPAAQPATQPATGPAAP